MRAFAFLFLALKRLQSRISLTLLLILSIGMTVGMMVCVPVFTNAVSLRIMQQELSYRVKMQSRPVFSMRFVTTPSDVYPMTLEEANTYRDWIADTVSRYVGLPVSLMRVQPESRLYNLQPTGEDLKYRNAYLGSVRVGYAQDVEKHIQFVQGAPMEADQLSDRLAVWLEQSFAQSMDVKVGENYDLAEAIPNYVPIPIRIAGLWQATDPNEPYWYREPAWYYQGKLLTTPQEYNTFIASRVPEKTNYVSWYLVLAGDKVNLDRAQYYIDQLKRAVTDIAQRIPGISIEDAPLEELARGQQRKVALSLILLAFSIPLMGVLVYFIISVSAMLARFQEKEIAMLASRGASRTQILTLTWVETAVILACACPLGVYMGLGLSQGLGYSLSFLNFTAREPLPVYSAAIDWRLVAVAVVFGVVARLVPSWISTRQSIVTQERRATRQVSLPGPVRLLLMGMLLAVTAYSYYTLAQRGSLSLVSWQPKIGAAAGASFDPLLLLAPSLFLFAAPLLAAELFVLLMRPVAVLARALPSVTAYLGCLGLGREGGQYRAPLYMLILSLSLGVFYASVARSSDIWLMDRRRYEIGADMTFDFARDKDTGPGSIGGGGDTAPRLVTIPVQDYARIVGVEAASAVGQYDTITYVSKDAPKLRLLGVDRVQFPRVAYFRPDYAEASLGDLMNRLAQKPNGILLPTKIAEQFQLKEGDKFALDVLLDTTARQSFNFEVVGTFGYFPTMYEKQKPVAVANLDYLELETGSGLPYGIWMRLSPDAVPEDILKAIDRLQWSAEHLRLLRTTLAVDQARLERVGIFGILSVCFVAGAVLSGLGLLLWSFVAMAARAVRFAVLQAMGLKGREVIGIVTVEYALTLVYGILLGTGLGVLASRLYVPFFAVTENPEVPIPPFIPYIDWDKAAWMAAVMGASLMLIELGVLWRASRARIFEVLRLGLRE